MGCDIHIVAQRKVEGGWVEVDIGDTLSNRCYGFFGWLAGVRNYSEVKPIAEFRGLPSDVSPDVREYFEEYHSLTNITLDELLAIDYHQEIEDRRCMIGNDGGCTCDEGDGEMQPLGLFLGWHYLADFLRLKNMGVDRLIVGFDC